MNVNEIFSHLDEKWSEKYKRSINCARPQGFSQRAHCAGRKKNESWDTHNYQSSADSNQIPGKMINQGFVISFEPATRQVTISKGDKVYSQFVFKGTQTYSNYQKYVNKAIEYIEGRHFKSEAVDTHKFALPAKNLAQLYAIKNKLAQPEPTITQPPVATAPATPTPEPKKSLSQLQKERDKLDTIIDYVQNRIPALVNRAEHTRLGIPPGLAADLEIDYPTPTTEAEMDEYLVFLARKEKMLIDHIRRARAVFKENINESVTNKFVKKFLPWVARELDIKKLPDIKLLDRPMNTSFGTYDSETNTLYLVTANRHPVDVLRTLAHELTHHKQNLAGILNPHSGATGTDEENEANANAGIVMRNFNQEYPEYLELKENFAGKRAGDTITQADIIRIRGDVNRLKQGNKAQRERGIRLERQLRTFLNTHRKPNPAVGAQQ